MTSLFAFDKKIISDLPQGLLAGVDEAGRGPLAGPVVAAAVILPRNFRLKGLADSKKLSPKKRERFYRAIKKSSISTAVGIKNNLIIDKVNIHNAALIAMKDAIQKLPSPPGAVVIDGPYRLKGVKAKQIPVIGGDNKSACVAAASIIAKVTRDRLMEEYGKKYPGYGFEKHKGYGTREHYKAIDKLGPCPIHRRSFTLIKPQ